MSGETYKRMIIKAESDNLSDVISFIEDILERSPCPIKAKMQIDLAVEEIFVNVASYAYVPNTGDVEVTVRTGHDFVSITFTDCGIPYDPLSKEDPDITLSAEERTVGGLGIFLTKKLMDDVSYEYTDGKNRLTLIKKY